MKPSNPSSSDQSSYTSSTSSTILKPFDKSSLTSSTSSKVSKPPRAVVSKKRKPISDNSPTIYQTRNHGKFCSGSRLFMFVFALAWISGSTFGLVVVIRQHLAWTRLQHATCEVDTLHSPDDVDIEVIPDSGDPPFIVRLNTTTKGVGPLKDGDTLPCFFGDDPACVHPSNNRNRTGDIYVQFNSDRRDARNTGSTVFCAFIAVVLILVGFFICCANPES